jgi:SAM-dependent methyltransferase
MRGSADARTPPRRATCLAGGYSPRMPLREPHDVWAIGAAYDAYVGRWSRPVARELVRWLAVPPGASWLDVGCGSGTLAAEILEHAAPRAVLGVDRSEGFVEHARVRVSGPRASFRVGDAQALPAEDGAFDAVVSGLVLNFVPQPARMVAEMARACRAGGVVGLYVWDYAAGMELIRRFWDAAKALDPAAAALDEAERFPVCAAGTVRSLFETARLSAIETRAIDVPTRFRDFDDYWSPFLGGQGPAPTYAMALAEGRRSALRERLRASLPFGPDGSIALTARAWAVRGTK